MGAWIETDIAYICIRNQAVAPYVGAWIETLDSVYINNALQSHPTWVRGLKLPWTITQLKIIRSHPTWVRGLKLHLYDKL